MEHSSIEAYGVVLTRMGADDLESVRAWRNSPEVSRYMNFRGHISAEMQTAWFHSLDFRTQYYYVIQWRGESVGVVNIKDCDFEKGEGEGGIYVARSDLWNTPVGMAATFAMYDFGFDVLGLKRLRAHILKENTRAIRFNRSIGFVLAEGQEDLDLQFYFAEREAYQRKTSAFKAYLLKG